LDESLEKAIWEEDNIRTSNLATLLGPSRQRKIIHKGEQNSNMCFPWGTWLHFLKESSQILVELTSLANMLKEKNSLKQVV
jgi:hypothetical protein